MGDASATRDARNDLSSRTIPTMELSTAYNPLTAPLEPDLDPILSRSLAARALRRFACPGNAVITGGAGTLALASARALLEHNASSVTLCDLPATLEASKTSINALKAEFPHKMIFTEALDVTEEGTIALTFIRIHALVRIDMLLCFAGVVGCVHSMDVTPHAFRNVIDVNLTGSFLCAQAAAQLMMPHGGGRILFISSISGQATNFPQPQAAYNVSKAGVLHMTKNLAAEWAVHGIRVNVVSPGYMDTVLNAGENLREARAVWASRCPMGRMGDPEELTGAVIMLMSKRAGRYITGANVTVDGGAMCF